MKKYIKSSAEINIDGYKDKMYKLVDIITDMASDLPQQCDNLFKTIPTRLDAIDRNDSLEYTRIAYGKDSVMLDHYCDVITDNTKELRELFYELENSLGLWDVDDSMTDKEEMEKLFKEQYGF